MFFSVGGTGAAGDGDSTGLLCFLLFFLAFGCLGLRFRSLDSIRSGVFWLPGHSSSERLGVRKHDSANQTLAPENV